jgi:hypothetical protein
MASRSANSANGRSSKSSSGSRPFVNLVIISISLGAFLRLAVARGWVDWPPTQIGPILTAFAGWVALTGPWILFRHEEQSGGMGVGDRVWITCGLALWIALGMNLAGGRMPSLQSITSAIGPKEMAVLAAATLAGGILARPSGSSWTWTNITGWLLAICWLTAAALPTGAPLWPIVAFGGR